MVMIKIMALKNKFTLILIAIFCALLLCVQPAGAFEDEEFFNPDEALDLAQQDNGIQFEDETIVDSDPASETFSDADWQRLNELIFGDSDSVTEAVNLANPIQQPGLSSAQNNVQLNQLLLLQGLFDPLTTGNANLQYFDYASFDNPNLFFNNPYRYVYRAKYQKYNYSNPFENFDDYYGFNDPMLQFYFDNPNLAPEDWLDQLGSAQKIKVKKYKPIQAGSSLY